ncbi:hypothetical protein B0T26DRAFT_651075 [Lasiosphaeria miniovina]|uniref:Uncharacterized protein n=1 Tax=Lasiosphaeria miniovina TaxID=1954250 RepID=A0AA40ADE8_9PEZI|nr:uncharacterized protein B0T26DRAFT_651075 [Lasiosphaeria miniovina]KAK0713813.1 hypothetical protein B0T26DRAFT_651075 [Lasiosphaeria miniovina]
MAQDPPKDVPPPTPVNFPRCYPQAHDNDQGRDQAAESTASVRPPKPLTSVLQGILRPAEINVSHLEALGVHVIPDSALRDLIPDPAVIPDFESWLALSPDAAHAANDSTRAKLNTGNLSPGCQVYLERRRELSIPNEAAYRAVRRVPPPKGQSQARLGNSYEFFRHLELFSTFWDDTSKPTPSPQAKNDGPEYGEKDNAGPADPNSKDGQGSENGDAAAQVALISRTGSGHQMPAEYRQNMIAAFIKLVAYDYGCNVSQPRVEPRLYLTSTASSGTPKQPRSSYFSSGCTFVFRTPTTREAARAGLVEGPLVAVSARHSTVSPQLVGHPRLPNPPTAPAILGTDKESTLDLARELVAALITAQHRAREGHTEKRVGEGAWWATKRRWGGGTGGPIGREVEMQAGTDETIGDKDEPPPSSPSHSQVTDVSAPPQPSASRPISASPWGAASYAAAASAASKSTKRIKKSGNLPMYDNYRMVRPPSTTWDKKTKYLAIGKVPGADYDDIFVISALFHHISVVRIRVPDRLLAVLQGEAADTIQGEKDGKLKRSWGRLEVRRSPWYDFFKVDDRIAAMHVIWSMMAYLMREHTSAPELSVHGEQGDVEMANA